MHELKSGELFAGYGGLALAVEKVFSAQTIWVSEISLPPSKVLASRFPNAQNLGDVTKISWVGVPKVDILSGGSPCQDVSLAGNRLGFSPGTRSNLWVEMRKAVEELKPELVVWENVKGVRSARADSGMEYCTGCLGNTRKRGKLQPNLRALGRVLGDLSEIGYGAQWVSIRASDIGAPHLRERVFVLAWREGGKYRYKPKSLHLSSTPNEGVLLPTPNTMDYLNWHEGEAKEKALRRGDYRRKPSARTGNLREEVHFNFESYLPAIRFWEETLGIKPPKATIDISGRPMLNPEFSEWVMGLPRGWVTDPSLGLTRKEQLQILGNGVVPQQAEYAIQTMYNNLKKVG
nr:MAG TPA: Cytosine specific methyltransferase [Caudoviricetes sp.]